jgi:hypothetical protein
VYSEIADIESRRNTIKERFSDRDRAMDMIQLVRHGDIDRLFPDLFSDDIPKSVVANLVDIAARDLAEVMAPLPNLACASGNMRSDADRLRASRKNKIGYNYWNKSQLERQMYDFADSYNTHGFAAFVVEADFDCMTPKIRVENPMGLYYSLNRWGECVEYIKETTATAGELAALYPEFRGQILSQGQDKRRRENNSWLTIVRYMDKDRTVIYLPECNNLPLASASNPCKRVPVAIMERFDLQSVPRGQFDDVLWVQLARSLMAIYQLQAADKSVNAPIALPDDVTEVSVGPDAVLRTSNPQAIQRVRLDVPRDSWMLSDQLDRESKMGARYPDARTGGVKGSIITGRGVEAMLGTFDTQIKTFQVLARQALETATALCFELDAYLWPNMRKKINGTMSGKSFEMEYVPARDIGDNYTTQVTYGFAAGMTPSQAIVTLLQLRGDKLIQRDTFRRALPFDVDPDEEQRGLDVEELEEGLKQGFMAMMQGIGPMMAQGADVQQVLMAAATAIETRQKGKPLHVAIQEAMKPPEAPPEEAQAAGPPGGDQAGGPAASSPGGGPDDTGEPNMGAVGQPGSGIRPSGLPQGVAPGQAGMGPGGMPGILSLISGMKNGKANSEASVMRKLPIGA